MKAKWLIISIALFIIYNTPGVQAESADLAEAEKTAWRYLTSLMRGDLEMSFSLMDPRVLNRRKADIAKAYEFAKKQGQAEEFKEHFKNIDDLDFALRLPARQFFVLVVSKDREKAPSEHLKAMQKTVVNVMGSSRIDAETAKVVLEVIPPKMISETPQIEALILTLYRGQWKVVETAK